MHGAVVWKIRPVLWKIHVQGKHNAQFVRDTLRMVGLSVGVPEEEPGLVDPPVYSVSAGLREEGSFTAEDLIAILHQAGIQARFSHDDRSRGAPGHVTRVMLADDHPVIRRGLADVLRERAEIEVVGEASDGEEAVTMALETQPDVILMDVSMPKLNGAEATRRIKSQLPRTRVIGLSMHEEPAVAAAMRDAGAERYLWKTATPESVITAVLQTAHATSG
jgi:CheY-like chemotaxis protein